MEALKYKESCNQIVNTKIRPKPYQLYFLPLIEYTYEFEGVKSDTDLVVATNQAPTFINGKTQKISTTNLGFVERKVIITSQGQTFQRNDEFNSRSRTNDDLISLEQEAMVNIDRFHSIVDSLFLNGQYKEVIGENKPYAEFKGLMTLDNQIDIQASKEDDGFDLVGKIEEGIFQIKEIAMNASYILITGANVSKKLSEYRDVSSSIRGLTSLIESAKQIKGINIIHANYNADFANFDNSFALVPLDNTIAKYVMGFPPALYPETYPLRLGGKEYTIVMSNGGFTALDKSIVKGILK